MKKIISNIKHVKQAGYINSKKLTSGTINKSYLVTTKQGLWVIRFNNNLKITGINRENEAIILDSIGKCNISPNIITNNIKQGYLITEFDSQSAWNKKDCMVNQTLFLEKLKLIHQISLPENFTSLTDRIRDYDKTINHMGIDIYRKKLNVIIDKLAELGFFHNNNTLVHCDLNPNNLIGNKPLRIIDWEFACKGHPIFDCAVFMHYNQLNRLQSQPVTNYCKQFENGLKILPIAQSLAAILANMWGIIHNQGT